MEHHAGFPALGADERGPRRHSPGPGDLGQQLLVAQAVHEAEGHPVGGQDLGNQLGEETGLRRLEADQRRVAGADRVGVAKGLHGAVPVPVHAFDPQPPFAHGIVLRMVQEPHVVPALRQAAAVVPADGTGPQHGDPQRKFLFWPAHSPKPKNARKVSTRSGMGFWSAKNWSRTRRLQ